MRIRECDKEKTGFITREGVFEFNKLLFGLINAPFTFKRIMNHIFKKYLYKIMVVYLDDILIFSETVEEHYKHLEIIFYEIRRYNMKLNIRKCQWVKKKLIFLGFEIENEKLNIDEIQRRKIGKLQPPSNIKELKSTLGFLSFFRRFINNYSKKTKVLQDRLKKDNFSIGKEEINCFENIKNKMMIAKPLYIPNFKKHFTLFTDACDTGIAGVLTQEENGKILPINWISRTLNAA